MGKLTRSNVPGKKAGPNGSFPIGNDKHARLAIAGATRSFNAGNISKGTEKHIKSEARAKLGENKPSGSVGKEVERRLAARDKK